MFVVYGLAAGFAFGLASAFANRVWGTVLAAVPVAIWFIFFGLALQDGLSSRENSALCWALFGIVVGVFMGQIFERKSARRRRRLRK